VPAPRAAPCRAVDPLPEHFREPPVQPHDHDSARPLGPPPGTGDEDVAPTVDHETGDRLFGRVAGAPLPAALLLQVQIELDDEAALGGRRVLRPDRTGRSEAGSVDRQVVERRGVAVARLVEPTDPLRPVRTVDLQDDGVLAPGGPRRPRHIDVPGVVDGESEVG